VPIPTIGIRPYQFGATIPYDIVYSYLFCSYYDFIFYISVLGNAVFLQYLVF